MQVRSLNWQRLTAWPARRAWGLAADGSAWSLVGLTVQAPGLLRVHTSRQFFSEFTPMGLGAQLREVVGARGWARQRVNMALAADELVMGVLEFPAQMPQEDWLPEIQLEVSQMLGQEPDEVHFDFQPLVRSDALVQRVQWVGCTQAQIAELKNMTRMAGWFLDSVEPAAHAAQRAASWLQGGLASLLTQPAQDWQFLLPHRLHTPDHDPSLASSWMPDDALQQAMKSEAGARLIASGLALKAWC